MHERVKLLAVPAWVMPHGVDPVRTLAWSDARKKNSGPAAATKYQLEICIGLALLQRD